MQPMDIDVVRPRAYSAGLVRPRTQGIRQYAAAASKLANLALQGYRAYKRYRPARGSKSSRIKSGTVFTPQGTFRRSLKSRRYRKRKRSSAFGKLKKSVRSLRKRTLTMGHLGYRDTFKLQPSSSSNQYGFDYIDIAAAGGIEAGLASIINAGTAAVSIASQSLPSRMSVKVNFKLMARNNYLYPCQLDVYFLIPKTNHSVAPSTSVTNGLTLQGGGSGTLLTSGYTTAYYRYYPTASKEFNDAWKIEKHSKYKLNTGDECNLLGSKSFIYDQEYQDRYGTTYTKKYSMVILVRVQGVVAHESATPANIGISSAKCDIVVERTIEATYPNTVGTKSTSDGAGTINALTTAAIATDSAETETAL